MLIWEEAVRAAGTGAAEAATVVAAAAAAPAGAVNALVKLPAGISFPMLGM
jgi:hypothetical protein